MPISQTMPTWLIGRNVTTATILPLAFDPLTGIISSSASAASFAGVIDDISLSESTLTENITPITSSYDNEVFLENNASITLAEILAANTTGVLAAAWNNSVGASGALSDHCQVILTRGSGTWTFYGIMQSYSESIRKGKSVCRMTIQMVHIGEGTPNPSLA